MQLVALHQLQSANQHNLVAVHSLAVFVNYQAAVGVAVIGDTYMSANLDNLLLQSLQMSGAAAVVDVDAVRSLKIATTSAPRLRRITGAISLLAPLEQSITIFRPFSLA